MRAIGWALMLLIPCPWCGPRDEIEFRYGGQAHIAYPADPEALSDAEWADYLFMRDNPKGEWSERWMHAAGCRRWFNVDALHGHARDRGRVPRGRGAAGDDGAATVRRAARWIDRSTPGAVHVRRPRARRARGRHAGVRAARERRGRGLRLADRSGARAASIGAGVEEPSAFVEVTRAVVRADRRPHRGGAGRGARGARAARAWACCRPTAPAPPRPTIGTCTSRRWWWGAARPGLRGGARGRATGDRVMLVDERPARRRRRDSTVPPAWTAPAPSWTRARYAVLTRATAVGRLRRRLRGRARAVACRVDGVWHVRAGRVVLATGAHERPIAFADNDRPGRDAGVGGASSTSTASASCAGRARRGVHHEPLRARRRRSRSRTPGSTIAAVVDVGRRGRATDATRARGIDVRERLGGHRHGRRPAVSRRPRRGTGRCHGDVRGRPTAGLRRLEPRRAALARHRRRAALRRGRAPASSPTAAAPPWLRIVGAAGRRRVARPSRPCWFTPADDLGRHFVDFQRDCHRRRRAGRGRARPALGRAREARHLHRHRDRPGTHQRRAHRRDREPGVGGRARRAGAHERPSSLHPGAVLRAGGPRPRAPSARPGAHHRRSTPWHVRAAPCSRTWASGSGPGTSPRTTRTWTPPSRRECLAVRRGGRAPWTPRRWARSS